MTEQQQNKQRAIDLLESRYRGMENVCEAIDMRLRMYLEDLLEHSSAREDDPNDWHGLYELLGAAKFLRCLDTYNFNTKKVQTVIRLRSLTCCGICTAIRNLSESKPLRGFRWNYVSEKVKAYGNNIRKSQ